jgi:flagellar protein FlgJ
MTIDPVRNPMMAPSAIHAENSNALRAEKENSDFQHQFRNLLSKKERLDAEPGQQRDDSELHKAFTDFVGQTLFGRLIASMRATQQEPAYMHGGQAEKIFQGQLDQVLAEEMTKSSADTIADPMYELFRMRKP